MRTCTLAGAILSLWSLAASAFAQSSSEQMIPAAERAHDFGTVARAAKTEHRFHIKNPFQQPLHLRSISASCGCTTPIIETEWIKPGEVGSVLARFNTTTFSGDRKATLNLSIDAPHHMQLQLNVKGYIRSDIVINPGELNFGSVAQGDGKVIEASIEYAGRSDWKLTGISGTEFIDGTLVETARSPGRVAYKLTAKLAPGAAPGPQAAELTLHTNDSRLKTVPVCCFAQIEAPISVSPSHINLGEMKPGQSVQQRLLIKGSAPFEVVDVTAPNMEVRFEPSQEPKAIQFLNLTLIPDEETGTGEIRTTLTITADMQGQQEIKLELSYKILSATGDTNQTPAELSDRVSSRARKALVK